MSSAQYPRKREPLDHYQTKPNNARTSNGIELSLSVVNLRKGCSDFKGRITLQLRCIDRISAPLDIAPSLRQMHIDCIHWLPSPIFLRIVSTGIIAIHDSDIVFHTTKVDLPQITRFGRGSCLCTPDHIRGEWESILYGPVLIGVASRTRIIDRPIHIHLKRGKKVETQGEVRLNKIREDRNRHKKQTTVENKKSG